MKTGAYRGVSSQGGTGLPICATQHKDDDSVSFLTKGASGTLTETNVAGYITTGTWHHIAVTLNKSASTAQIYIDGVKRADNKSINTNGTFTLGSDFYIGSNISSEKMNGPIDDVRLFTKVLSQTEIDILSNNGTYVSGNDLRLKLVEESESTARVSEIRVEYTV